MIIASLNVLLGGKGEGRMRFVFYLVGAGVAGLFAATAIVLAAFNDVASGLAISFPAVLLTTHVLPACRPALSPAQTFQNFLLFD